MLNIQSFEELVREEIEPVKMILEPWLPVEGLAMIAGPTGLGKTMLALGCALAIASGTKVLQWRAPEARRVLYVDGEMALIDMKRRIAALTLGQPEWRGALANIYLCSHAMQPNGIPNLITSREGRRQIETIMEAQGIDVMILDNLSAVCNSAEENSAESWTVMQDWLIKLRRQGYSVIFLHHTGKVDDRGHAKQRGTSKREDVLNTTILLEPDGNDTGFLLKFTKHRGFEPQHEAHVCMHFDGDSTRIEMDPISQKVAKMANDPALDT